jgi:hypothetical protein
LTYADRDEAVYEVRSLWYEDDGSVIIQHQQVVPRRWWNHITRPIGLFLIVAAIIWPLLLFRQGWVRASLFFACGDPCVVFLGVEMMRAGGRRWKE